MIWNVNETKSPEPERLFCNVKTSFMFEITPLVLSIGEAVNDVCPAAARNEPSLKLTICRIDGFHDKPMLQPHRSVTSEILAVTMKVPPIPND
jgi:hypothetical protein